MPSKLTAYYGERNSSHDGCQTYDKLIFIPRPRSALSSTRRSTVSRVREVHISDIWGIDAIARGLCSRRSRLTSPSVHSHSDFKCVYILCWTLYDVRGGYRRAVITARSSMALTDSNYRSPKTAETWNYQQKNKMKQSILWLSHFVLMIHRQRHYHWCLCEITTTRVENWPNR